MPEARGKKFPTDLVIRFEMGVLYFKAGKIGEAIQEFQKSKNNPNKKIAVDELPGAMFRQTEDVSDLAAKTFQEAIKEKQIFDEEKEGFDLQSRQRSSKRWTKRKKPSSSSN